jgi:indole-3-glycerol phosphate synthase
MPAFLEQILARKRVEVEERRAALPERELSARAAAAPRPRRFEARLSARGGPSIDAGLDAPAQAVRYAAGGAAAISVLTDGPGFGGSLDDLRAVRAAVEIPILRKDFVLDRYQLLEARAAGGDAVLLIVAALDPDALRRLLEACGELGMAALVEVHDAAEAERALWAGARIVGVNNRDLRTFAVDLAASERILPSLPAGVKAVAESGIRTAADARRLRKAGASNLLVGEALVRAPDPARLLAELHAAEDPA